MASALALGLGISAIVISVIFFSSSHAAERWLFGKPSTAEQISAPVFVRPLFGPHAIARCNGLCGETPPAERALCRSACSRLGLKHYALRLTKTDQKGDEGAKIVLNSCKQSDRHPLSEVEVELWKEKIYEALVLIDTASPPTEGRISPVLLYDHLIAANNQMSLPEEATERQRQAVLRVITASCILANIELAYSAFAQARDASDELSQSYYGEFIIALLPEADRARLATLDFARESGLYERGGR